MHALRFLALVVLFTACGPALLPCDATSCAGCCDQQTGRCESGTRASACGSAGLLCVACAADEACGPDFRCHPTSTPRCDAASCDGCCNSSGQCFSGLEQDRCGSGGALCTGCGTATCVASGTGGRCREP